MAPTSDERREVAERLKEYATGFDFGDSNPWWYVQKAVFGDVIAHDTSDAFALLADLIDPTCHIAPDDWASQQCMGPMLSCDRCQAAFPEINSPYVYCPNCGARVVEG